nr:Uncharacterised protein [Klebsiella pneumoniae]
MAAAGHHRTARRVANGSCGALCKFSERFALAGDGPEPGGQRIIREAVFSPQAGTVEIVENGFSRWPVAHKPQMYKRGCECFSGAGKGPPLREPVYL